MPVPRRFYQDEAIDKTRVFFEGGFQSGIVQMATGAGKSVVQYDTTKLLNPIQTGRTLLIGGLSRDLNNQALRGFKRQYPECGMSIQVGNKLRPGIGLVMGKHNAADARIIVGSAQTLMPRFLNVKGTTESELIKPEDVEIRNGGIYRTSVSKRRWLISPRFDEILAYGPISLWLHDEAHHAPADGSMWAIGILTEQAVRQTGLTLRKGEIIQGQLDLIYRYLGLPKLRVIGYTATPVRADSRAMANVFQKIISTFTDRQAEEAGMIRPIHPNVYRVKILTEMPTLDDQEDLSGPDDEQAGIKLSAVQNWQDRIVEAFKKHASDRTAVAFVGPIGGLSAIDASKSLCKAFNAAQIPSCHVDGSSWMDTDGSVKSNKLRPALFDRIQRGELKVICNFGVLTEGIDITRLDCVLLARSVNAPMLTQILGRARRNFTDPETGKEKEDALLIDFTGKPLVILTAGMLRGIKVDLFEEDQEEKPESPAEDENRIIIDEEEGEEGADFRDLSLKKGVANSYKISDIVRRSAGQWYTAPDLKMSLAVSETDALLITMPHFASADYYLQIMNREDIDPEVETVAAFLYEVYSQFTLWHTTKAANGQHFINGHGFIEQNPALDLIEASAVEYAESRENYVPSFATKGRPWRRDSISAKQIKYLLSLLPDFKDYGKLSSGEAAQIITHALADRAVSLVINRMRGFIEEYDK